MAHDGSSLTNSPVLAGLLDLTATALPEVEAIFERAREALRAMVTVNGKISAAALEEHQFAAHSLSWFATYTESLRQMQAWALRLQAIGCHVTLLDHRPAAPTRLLCLKADGRRYCHEFACRAAAIPLPPLLVTTKAASAEVIPMFPAMAQASCDDGSGA